VNDVLRDRDAYILFYAREEATGMGRPPKRKAGIAFANDVPITPPKKVYNTIEKSNGTSNGKHMVSDDEDDNSGTHKLTPQKSREPLESMANRVQGQSFREERTYAKPNGFGGRRAQATSQTQSQPPQVIRGAESQFFKDLDKHNHPSQSTASRDNDKGVRAQSRPTLTKHSPAPLQITSHNPYAADKDPFYTGAIQSQQRRPNYPGIASQLQPGVTSSFNRDDRKLGIKAQRDGLGIRLNRKHLMQRRI
jgi:hypothetical protein